MQPYRLIFIIIFALLNFACGVKGDPVPPQRPTELGRGRPTYKRATERVKVQPQVVPDEEDEDEKDEDSE